MAKSTNEDVLLPFQFTDEIFEVPHDRKRNFSTSFTPNYVGNLNFLEEARCNLHSRTKCDNIAGLMTSMRRACDLLYFQKDYESCLQIAKKTWDMSSDNAMLQRDMAEFIVRCYIKLRKFDIIEYYLEKHAQLSNSEENYVGYLQLCLSFAKIASMDSAILLTLQRLLMALPLCESRSAPNDDTFPNDDGPRLTAPSVRGLLWLELSSIWSKNKHHAMSKFLPVWFQVVALFNAEFLGVETVDAELLKLYTTLSEEKIRTVKRAVCKQQRFLLHSGLCSSELDGELEPVTDDFQVRLTRKLPYFPTDRCVLNRLTDGDTVESFYDFFIKLFVPLFES